MAERKYRLPHPDAEAVVQEAMISLLTAGTNVMDVRSWLVAAVCNGSRHYWRRESIYDRANAARADEEKATAESVERLERLFLVSKALDCLSEKQREALRLHYFEGMTANEIANRFGTSRRYAEKLIHMSLKRARKVVQDLSHVVTSREAVRKRGDGKASVPTPELEKKCGL